MLSDYFRQKDLAHSPEHWNVISENHPISMLVLRANRERGRGVHRTVVDWVVWMSI